MFYRHSCTEYKTINRFIIGHSISEILDFKNDLFGNLNLAVYVKKFGVCCNKNLPTPVCILFSCNTLKNVVMSEKTWNW